MPMISDPSTKYLPYSEVPFPDGYVRKWPTRRTTTAPIWLSTDLRDGNQALVNPMANATKLEYFKLLVSLGFKEIEVAYPSASVLEFEFVRSLIENNEVPDDVSLQIITPARADLITKSIASLAGAKHGIIHLYNAVSPLFREVVFRNSKEQTIDLTLAAVRLVKKLTAEETARSGTKFTLNYCLETFSQTEADFAVQLGNKVLETWGTPTSENKVIFNLAATVECAPSNHYADMVEYFSTYINHRENVIISIHPHNDRGTAVAAAELALLAGGDRIEGCLLGNGERTGNVDLITLALNLYSQGISPSLSFSNLSEVVSTVCRVNEVDVPARYPYAGALVFSAFAGTHQDAIKKGLEAMAVKEKQGKKTHWTMPYIPLDPKDLGYGYENLIRVSSQSGKAGIAYVVRQTLGLDLPRKQQVAFYKVVQAESEETGKEMTVAMITTAFKATYYLSSTALGRLHLQSYKLLHNSEPSSPLSEISDDPLLLENSGNERKIRFEGQIEVDGKPRIIHGVGSTPVEALLEALRLELDVTLSMNESISHAINIAGKAQRTAVYLDISSGEKSVWGVGISRAVSTAKLRAIISGANAVVGDQAFPRTKMVFNPRIQPAMGRTDSWVSLNDVKMRAGHGPVPTPERETASEYFTVSATT